jgi:hypothetical protein
VAVWPCVTVRPSRKLTQFVHVIRPLSSSVLPPGATRATSSIVVPPGFDRRSCVDRDRQGHERCRGSIALTKRASQSSDDERGDDAQVDGEAAHQHELAVPR